MERKDSGTRELTLHMNCPHCNEGKIGYITVQRYLPLHEQLPQDLYRESGTDNVISTCIRCNGNYKLEELELEDK